MEVALKTATHFAQLFALPNGSDRRTFQPTLNYSSGCLQHVTSYALLAILTSRINEHLQWC
jgi:hypothetical protein